MRALWCLLPVVVGFLPPVTGWAAAVGWRPFGLPFLIAWNGLMIVLSAALMMCANVVRRKGDGE
jgi:hypothetical protein